MFRFLLLQILFQSLKNYSKIKRSNPTWCPLLVAVLERIKRFMKAYSVTYNHLFNFHIIKPVKLSESPGSNTI
jgi:hypothetical protein